MTKIQVTPAIDSMAKGNAQQLTATGIYSDHSTVDITNSVNWISTNTNNVEVNKVGLASGKGVGAASITAEKEGITSNAGTMKVTNAVLTSIQVTAEMARMPKGVVQQLTATGSYSDGTTANITAQVSWLSTATSQIKVNTKGIAIAGAEGKSTITAKQGDITSNKMTLTSTAAELTDIQVTPAKAQVANGETLQLKAMGTFSDNSTVDVTDRVAWHSSRAGVVTIMTNGIVTGGGEGDVTVSAADDGVNSKEVIITVTAAVLTEIQVTPAKFSVAKGHAQQLIAIGTYSDKTTADISDSVDWQSTDTANVTVSAKGMISGVNKGDSIITAGKNTITSNKTTITVTSAVLMKVLVTPIDSIVAKGNSQQLKAEGSYSDQSVVDISSIVAWHSNDSDSVTISSTGLAKGVDIGSTTITAMKDEINSNAAKINVTDALLMQIQVTPAQSIVAKGNTQQLTAIGTYTDNSTVDITKAVSWHSSEVDQLTVSDQGVATGVDIGMPTVTASKGDIGSLPASVQVTSAALQKIQVTPVQSSVAKGNTQKFIAMGTYSDKSTVDISDSVSWHSSSTSEVTISATGMAEGVGEGKSDITANKNAIGSNTASMRVTPAVLVTIQVTPAAATVVEGATQQLTATGIYSDDTTADISDRVSWHSTETDNVTVTAKGLASGVGVGSSTITATLGEVTSNDEKMTVSKAVLAHIQVTPASFSLAKGNTQQLSATGVYNNGTTFEITDSVDWHSLNLAEVTVNKTGLAAGMNKGVAQVTATKGSITSSQVTINVTDAVLTDIQITPANISIAQGNTQQLKAIGTYSDDSSKDITESVSWQTGNIDTVTLSALGIATGESTGKTTITAVKDKKTSNVANIEVTSAELTDIQITPAQSTLAKGNTQQLVATGIYSNDTVVVITGSVSWKSSSTDDVTVTPKGLATGVNEGKVTISATKGGVRSKHTATIQVSAAVLTSIQVTPPLTHVAMGNTQQLTAMGIYSDKSSADISDSVSWHAEDIEKVTMSATGLATGVDTGSTAITAIKDTHTSNEVTVEVTDALLTQIQVTPKQSSVAKGNTQQLTATGTYSDKTTKDISENVTWKSYDTSFATVSDKGLATGVGVGDATITAATTALTSESVSMHVTAAVLESIEVTPAAPTVTKTKTQQFRAMGTYNDKAIEDITTSVDWHSSAIDKVTMTTSGLATGVDVGTSTITATKSGLSSNDATMTVNAAYVTKLDVEPNRFTLPVGATKQLKATGTYNDGSTGVDITDIVNWVTPYSRVTVTNKGLVTAVSKGLAQISASIEGGGELLVANIEVTVTDAAIVDQLGICGGAVNDTSQSNAVGECLKVISMAVGDKTNMYTASPSKAVMDALGYNQATGTAGVSKTYAGLQGERRPDGPEGSFATFNQLGGESGAVNGQYDQWCQHLAAMNFANKKSWRRPSNIELKLLASEKKNLWENYGWPTTDFYWSKTNESNDAYYSIGLGINYGLEHGDLQSHSNYGACISIE